MAKRYATRRRSKADSGSSLAHQPELYGNPLVGMPDDTTLRSPHLDPLTDLGSRPKLEAGAAQGKIENSAGMHFAV